MKEPMSWEECRKHITFVDSDIERVRSLVSFAEAKLDMVKDVVPTEANSSVLAVDYYDMIKELLIALMLRNSLKSDNHECLIAFLKKNYPELGYEADKVHELKEVRNRISYDGYRAKRDYLERNLPEFKNIISEIRSRIIL